MATPDARSGRTSTRDTLPTITYRDACPRSSAQGRCAAFEPHAMRERPPGAAVERATPPPAGMFKSVDPMPPRQSARTSLRGGAVGGWVSPRPPLVPPRRRRRTFRSVVFLLRRSCLSFSKSSFRSTMVLRPASRPATREVGTTSTATAATMLANITNRRRTQSASHPDEKHTHARPPPSPVRPQRLTQWLTNGAMCRASWGTHERALTGRWTVGVYGRSRARSTGDSRHAGVGAQPGPQGVRAASLRRAIPRRRHDAEPAHIHRCGPSSSTSTRRPFALVPIVQAGG